MDDDLVHKPELFDCQAWLHVTNASGWADYRPLVAELEEPPISNRPEGSQFPKFVEVRKVKKGRTGKREVQVYPSLTQAMKEHGRPVRSSIETDRPVGTVRARKVEVVKVQTLPGGSN